MFFGLKSEAGTCRIWNGSTTHSAVTTDLRHVDSGWHKTTDATFKAGCYLRFHRLIPAADINSLMNIHGSLEIPVFKVQFWHSISFLQLGEP
jgi:hypothetical protein